MKNILVILSLFLALQVHAQIQTRVFGDISDEEIEMTSYEKDPEAKAVVLFDKGESVFFDAPEKTYKIRFTKHKRIKVFKNNDQERSQIIIPFYVGNKENPVEQIKTIEATTYNMIDGELVSKKLDPSQIYEEQTGDKTFIKKFVFPDVQDGSIIEYQYTLEANVFYIAPNWVFQDDIPTIYSEYKISMIPYFEYAILLQEIATFDYFNTAYADKTRIWGNVNKAYAIDIGADVKFKDLVHTYGIKDVPAFNNEAYISSPNDYLKKIEFQLAKINYVSGGYKEIISTWPELNRLLLDNSVFGVFIRNSNRLASRITQEEIDLTGLRNEERAKVLIDYVKNNFKWNGNNSYTTSQTAKEFFNAKTGSAAEINLFLIALLRAARIDADPVILSTRDHGKINTNYPFLHFTNYVIVKVNTPTSFLADATETLLPFNRIPNRCLNEKGLIVNKEKEDQWVNLESSFVSQKKSNLTLSLDPATLDLHTKVSIQSTEYDAYSNRMQFKNDTTKIKEYYAEKVGRINKIRSINYRKRIASPYSLYMLGTFETEKIANKIVFKPFLNLPIAENKLTQKERTYPIDFVYPSDEAYLSILEIPENCSVSKLPEAFVESNELIDINLSYKLTGKTLKVEGNYKFKKTIYQASEYKQIKNYLDQIVTRFNEPIVIEVKD